MSEPQPTSTGASAPARAVRVVDIPLRRVRRPADLVLMLTAIVGIIIVLILGVFASRTTTAVIADIEASPLQAIIRVVTGILLLPINVIEGSLTLLLPIAVIVERLVRRNPRAVVEAIAAAIAAALIAAGLAMLIFQFAPTALRDELRVWELDLAGVGHWAMTISPPIAALAALLTATGTRDRSRVVLISWNLLWVVLVVAVITGTSTIVGALVSVLVGRSVGLGIRYLSGVLSERAHGDALVTAIRRAGIDPVSVVRMTDAGAVDNLRVETVAVTTPLGYTTSESALELPPPEVPTEPVPTDTAMRGIAAQLPESATVTVEREGLNRVYAVLDTAGTRWDAVVLDRDRQVIGLLAWLWSAIRLRGFGRRNAVSLRQASDRAVLMTYAADAARVNCPRLRGIARAEDSIVLVGEHVAGARNLADFTVDRVTDGVMLGAWEQLERAHRAGLSHRNISAETVLLVGDGPDEGTVYLSGWEQGDIASSIVSRRIDQVQLLMTFAVRVGAERACAIAAQVLTAEELPALTPLLQSVALPALTQAEARRERGLISAVRTRLVEYLPQEQAPLQPFQLTRFSARTVITVTIAVIAGWVLLTTLNFREILTDAANANPMWLLAAFGLGLVTYLGSALGLVAFSPQKLGLWRTTLVQVAASVIALVAPAGVGPAALNLRFMQKRGLDTPMAVATVALLQVSQFVTTVLLLVAIVLLTGSQGALAQVPSGTIVVILLGVLAIAGVLFAIPALRRWLLALLRPTLKQVWPRVVWVIGQPGRLLMGIAGNLLMTAGYLAAFAATLAAFGQTLPLTTLVVVFLTGTTIGSAVPTPGGIGAVEGALFTGLRTAGVVTSTATSTAVMFRVLTFWIRVPLGWVALRYLQKRNAV